MSDWYYAANNEQKGPINESELKADLATGKLPGDTLVWKDGMDGWAPANQVPAFTFRQPPAPAKVQPTVPATATTPAMAVTSATTTPNPASVTPVTTADLLGTPEALEVSAEDAEKNKIFGILAYVWILFIVPLLAAKDSPFARYHANQGLVLFVGWLALAVAITIVNVILSMILPGGLLFVVTILGLVDLVPFVLMVMGIINAANGKCLPLPIIGGIKLIK